MKGNKIFWIVLAVILLAAILWVTIPELKKLKQGAGGSNTGGGATGGNTGGNAGSTGSGSGTGVAPTLNYSKSLYKGVTGAEVRELQTLLNQFSQGGNIAVDGIFGNQTYNKLIAVGLSTPVTLTIVQNFANKNNVTTSTGSGSGLNTTGFWFSDWIIKQFAGN